jgi:hypothetical protein
MIKVKLGTPRLEGSYEVNLVLIKLRKGLPDSDLILKEPISTIQIKVTDTGLELRTIAIKSY